MGESLQGAADTVELARANELSALYRLTDRLYRALSLADVYDASLDAITATLGCSRASVLLFDDQGVMQFVAWRGLSDTYRTKLTGHTPWKPGTPDPPPIYVGDIEDTDEPGWIKDIIRKENIRALGFIPLVAEGVVIGKFMTYYDTPRSFPEHETDLAITISRQLGFSIERDWVEKARARAIENLRESEERFRLMSEHAPVMIWMSHPDGSCAHLNRMLRDFWNVDEAGIENFDWQQMMHPEDAPEITRQIVDAMTRRTSITILGRYFNAERRVRVLQTSAQPRLSQAGEFLGMIGVNVDITERELLLAELNHRVKNTLAVVQGIAHQTFKNTESAGPALQAFEGRLAALAAAHGLLTRASWESASLKQLAADALKAAGPESDRVSFNGPHVDLPPREALAIAMALHELTTNAIKYGALSNDDGRVALGWERLEAKAPRLRLVWREHDGPPVAPPTRRGFGSLLLETTLAHDLDGTVSADFRPEGLVCSIEAPLPRERMGAR